MQPVIWRNRETGERELAMMRWGIVPWFAKTEIEFKKLSTINLKSDRLTDSKMWRAPFAKRRCLVPTRRTGCLSRSSKINLQSRKLS